MSNDYIVDVDHLTIRFNMATEKVDNLKEYVIKLIKHELMFQEFLALKDVSLKVKRGEAWGLIGTNGSGKSTLLKACCGILKPYKGTVTTKGTIAPLIELGAQVLAADRLEIVSPEKDRVLIPAQFDTRADESVMSLAVLGF